MNSNRNVVPDNRVFLFFLLSATFLWFITKFSKQSLSTTTIELVYNQLPDSKLLGKAPRTLFIELAANGFEFSFYKIKTPKVEINLNKYYDGKSNHVRIDKEALQFEISKTLEKESVLSDASIKYIDIYLDHIDTKEVPILVQSKIGLQKGYRLLDSILIDPISVKISAPSKLLDSIEYIKTEVWESKNINKSHEKKLKLLTPNLAKIYMDTEQVNAKVQVREFTQKSFQVPINIINKPEDITLMLIPEKLNIIFDVDIENYNLITKTDFIVICDYNKRNETTGQLFAEIQLKHPDARQVRLSETSIDYLIFK